VTRTEDEAQDLLERIQQGDDMGELARNYSAAPEALQDGDVGWVARGELEESMEKALFSLPEGKISGIVKTPYGYHIFQVTGNKPEGIRELPEVVQEIESHLLREKREAFCQKWLEELRKLIVVEVSEKLLEGT
jgi:parvulin-like peptidyl-prolyl isomerase